MASISFSDNNLNVGTQVGVNNGSLNIHYISTIRPLAHSLYKSLFSSSELFSQIRDELGLLLSVLSATEEHTRKVHTDNEQFPELRDALSQCHDALQDLSRLKEHFDSVGPQAQVAWERVGWAGDELVDIRAKLTLYINVLNVLNTNMIRSSHENVERMLRAFMSEIRSGKRDSSAMSSLSAVSHSADENEEYQWEQLRKELDSIGITPDIFSRNLDFILATLCNLSQEDKIMGGMAPLPHIPKKPPVDTQHFEMRYSSSNEALAKEALEAVVIYEGYVFRKADPVPGREATWTRAERWPMDLTQGELHNMVQKRARKKTVARQYCALSEVCQAHVHQLIRGRWISDGSVDWICVYVKKHKGPANNSISPRNLLPEDCQETVSMNVILRKMPLASVIP